MSSGILKRVGVIVAEVSVWLLALVVFGAIFFAVHHARTKDACLAQSGINRFDYPVCQVLEGERWVDVEIDWWEYEK